MVTISNWLPLNNVGVLGPRLVSVVESSEVVASRRFLLHCFNGSSVGGSRVGRSREVGRFSEGSIRVYPYKFELRGLSQKKMTTVSVIVTLRLKPPPP